jgi:hypothetical protein
MRQVIRPPLLREGFDLVQAQSLEVTDDVSIIEALGKPVRITPGSYTNIKARRGAAAQHCCCPDLVGFADVAATLGCRAAGRDGLAWVRGGQAQKSAPGGDPPHSQLCRP